MRDNRQFLFLIQFSVAFVTIVSISNIVDFYFSKDNNFSDYIALDRNLETMSKSKNELLKDLISNNELTIDPTNGTQISKVLSNLKVTDSPKVLIIGSSQLIVVQGDKTSGAFKKIISSKINYFTNKKYEVYNLSLGGMTTSEKLIIAKEVIKIINPEHIVISATPWDSVEDKVREGLQEIEYEISKENMIENTSKEVKQSFQFPISINDYLESTAQNNLFERIELYKRKEGLKLWIEDSFKNLFYSIKTQNEGISFKSNIPGYWQTQSQEYNDATGWDSLTKKSGQRSLVIKKTTNPSKAQWFGNDIKLNQPSKKLHIQAWSKAENVSDSTSLYCLYLDIKFKNEGKQSIYKNYIFTKGSHDWEKREDTLIFKNEVISIRPFLMFHDGIGTVWFDDISIKNLDDNNSEILPNIGFEIVSKERKNVSYLYNKNQWKQAFINMQKLIDLLAVQQNGKNAFLLTPFWFNEKNAAYPQEDDYLELISKLEKYCQQKDVTFINASYIMDSSNFGYYTFGLNKDKIDVLHFDENGHTLLAKYISNELGL